MSCFETNDPAFGRFAMGWGRPTAGDGVHCIAADGHPMGQILVPPNVSNLCFGGRAKHQLYITATTSLYAITLNRVGAQRP